MKLLALNTAVKPAKKFTVDGEEFLLLGVDNLSAEQEATALALFARHGNIARALEFESNVDKGKTLALRLRSTRLDILCLLTDMPKDVADRLPAHQQVKLLDAIQAELEEEPFSEGDEDGPEVDKG